MRGRNWFGKVGIGIMVTSLLLTTGCASTVQKSGDHPFKIAMVTDTGGLQDESFNQTTWKGCNECKDKLGASIQALESKKDEDYVPNLTRLARDSTDLIWATGFKFAKAVPEVAKKFSDKKFGVIDTNLNGQIPQNVISVTFKEEEAAFLVGVAAALTTKTNKIGFIGGINSELIEKFRVGYTQGAKAVNSKCQVEWAYTDSFTDATKGRSLASTMYNSGVDVIFHAAGSGGKGMFEEVKTREKGKFWAIGVDCDQSKLAPNHTLTSLIKHVDTAVFEITKSLKEGHFNGGIEKKFGLKEKGVNLVEMNLPESVKKKVNEFRLKIIRGEINVAKKENELKE